ncbi:YidH family protein [Marinomonas pollencensis]|uniref:Putative membrane protein n=1 Tax=Marinomonas pollencensis TaxID=491954 RepID=A0A3E0DKL2_9GAMM|nr:DUF202 domain-containing protein [Marinomonas pollencensis]REG83237.1 putative membrane protein [Marinomonas pollencensis]
MWRKAGKAPDYRFTLANERTFLAWIRTALAFLAAAVGVDQLAPNIAPMLYREILVLVLSVFSALLAFYAYRRWRSNEKAMRHEAELTYPRTLAVISFVMIAVIVFVVYLMLRYKA